MFCTCIYSGIILRKFCKSSKPKVWNFIDEKRTASITSSHSSNNMIDNLAVHGWLQVIHLNYTVPFKKGEEKFLYCLVVVWFLFELFMQLKSTIKMTTSVIFIYNSKISFYNSRKWQQLQLRIIPAFTSKVYITRLHTKIINIAYGSPYKCRKKSEPTFHRTLTILLPCSSIFSLQTIHSNDGGRDGAAINKGEK